MSIVLRVFIAVGVLFFAVMSVQGLATNAVVQPALRDAVLVNLEDHASGLTNSLVGLLDETEADLTVLSAHKSIEDYLTFLSFEDLDSAEESLSSLEGFLVRINAAKPQYRTMQVVANGKVALQLNDGQRTEVFEALDTSGLTEALAKGYVHRVRHGDAGLMLQSIGPLKVNGKVEGVIWISQPLDQRLQRFFADLDKQGYVGAISGAEGLIAKSEQPGAEQVANGDSGWVTSTVDMPRLGWRVTLGMDEKQAYAALDRLLWVALGIGGVSLVVAIVVLRILLAYLFTRPINEFTERMCDIARGEGDLTRTMRASGGKDEFSRMAEAFNHFVGKIRETVQGVQEMANRMAEESSQLTGVCGAAENNVVHQQEDLDQVATAMNEMTATIHEVAKTTAHAAGNADQTNDEAKQGRRTVETTIETIHSLAREVEQASQVIGKLEADSEAIGAILDVIREIADQTNLLALNAAIEAARAGEQGRGFAVVADEVRTLASRTQKSTEEIQQMIVQLQNSAKNATQVMEAGRRRTESSVAQVAEAGEILLAITRAVGNIADLNTQIATSAEEQTAVSEDINRRLVNINQLAADSAEGVKETYAFSERLAEMSGRLRTIVGQFKV